MQQYPAAEFFERTLCINCGAKQFKELSRGRFSDQPLLGFIEADPWGESPVPFLRDAEWILVECANCGQVFHKRILTNEWNERRFSKWMSAEAIREFELRVAGESPLPARRFEKAREHIEHILRIEKLTNTLRKPSEPLRLLDFGCGWGDFLVACRHFGWNAFGVDRSTARMEGASIQILPSLDDLKDLPPFHVVTLFEVLEHIDEPASILGELAKLVVPGGLLVMETPDCKGITGIQSHWDYRKVHPLEHINAFTNKSLKSIALRHGFAAIPRGPAHATGSLMRVLKREVKHRLGLGDASTQLYFRKI
jgi:SAM-dependent methyltransferase